MLAILINNYHLSAWCAKPSGNPTLAIASPSGVTRIRNYQLSINSVMLPPEAEKKMQCWIRSRHLISSGNLFIFETVDYSAIERFTESIEALGGTLISVDSIGKIWIGDRRQVVLYQATASLHTPHHQVKQYWIKYGSFRTRFDERI